MAEAGDNCSRALANLRVPFLSCSMGGIETGVDLRSDREQGTRYNGSGCLIHGLSVLADSFQSLSDFADSRSDEECCQSTAGSYERDFKDDEALRQYLVSSPKFGNNIPSVDGEAVEIVARVSERIRAERRTTWVISFRPDWSSPSTHLLYGYWTGATPDGRRARTMLGYGVDPLYGETVTGMNTRLLSLKKLPYESDERGLCLSSGNQSGLFFLKSPLRKKARRSEERSWSLSLTFPESGEKVDPFYLYVNVTTAETLRKVLEKPEKYAPSGVYIMRIHGTFVNFLDLSPSIQEDIILRLNN